MKRLIKIDRKDQNNTKGSKLANTKENENNMTYNNDRESAA